MTSSDWADGAFDELNDAFDIKFKEEETLDITLMRATLKNAKARSLLFLPTRQKTARKTISMPVVSSTTW